MNINLECLSEEEKKTQRHPKLWISNSVYHIHSFAVPLGMKIQSHN